MNEAGSRTLSAIERQVEQLNWAAAHPDLMAGLVADPPTMVVVPAEALKPFLRTLAHFEREPLGDIPLTGHPWSDQPYPNQFRMQVGRTQDPRHYCPPLYLSMGDFRRLRDVVQAAAATATEKGGKE